MRPRLLDLFCGAGGCSVGYHRAGFDVVGVDIEPHPDYPFEFHVRDALDVLTPPIKAHYDVIHASPPCPAHSTITPNKSNHPDLIPQVRELLQAWGGPYVIENVPGAPLENPVTYCGAAMGLGAKCRDGVFRQLRRHRLFESNLPLMSPGCACDSGQKLGVYGTGGGGYYPSPNRGGGYKAWPDEAAAGMGIDWMSRADLADAIPPAYTEHIGAQLLAHLEVAA